MNPSLRNKMAGATAGGAIVMATVLIQWHEGVRYTPYRDSGGVLTVCAGHTGNVISDKSYTQKECDSLLDSDLKTAMAMVDANVTVPLTDSQRATLVSFVYNVGSGAFARSILLKKLNTGDIPGACDEMRRWVYIGPGLARTGQSPGGRARTVSARTTMMRWKLFWVIATLLALMTSLALYYRALYLDTEKDRQYLEAQAISQQVALELLNRQMQTISALDARHTKELADVQAKNDDLRRKLDRGGRVLVKGNCPVSTTSPSSLGHAGTIELSSIAGRNVLDIRAGIISDQAKIKYFQDYIRRIIDETDKK